MNTGINPMSSRGASLDLGMSSLLPQQVKQETEEERRRRMAGLPPGGASDLLFGAGTYGG